MSRGVDQQNHLGRPSRRWRKRLAQAAACGLLLLGSPAGSRAAGTNSPIDLLIVAGAPGESEFGQVFNETVQDWVQACRAGNKSFQVIEPLPGETNQLERIRAVLTNQPAGDQELWIALVGHGTFDGKDAKFNLAGPDLSATECAAILKQVQRPIVFINTSSASAPFINALSGPNRMIVTATKSGFEENYARFGKYFARAMADLSADLDKDGQVSLLEAFLMASRQVDDFYKGERRLSTEHALIDDNGDGKGTPASFYRGVRPAKKPEEAANLDGFRAHQVHFVPNEAEAKLSPPQRKKRNDLEMQLEQARARKAALSEEAYLKEIEPILLELAHFYHEAAGAKTESKPATEAGAEPSNAQK